MNGKQRCLARIHNQPADRVPVFPLLMFYAQQRAGITYREFATNHHALAEAQLSIHERFPVDALTVCSDAFRLPADLGAEMSYPENKTPFAHRALIASPQDLQRLGHPDPMARGSRMHDRVLAVHELAKAAGEECLVCGWVEMPFAEACSLVGVSDFMMLLLDDPAFAHEILEFVTGLEIEFALAQLAAGAPLIGAGDAAASLISTAQYAEFALPYEQRVVNAIHQANGLAKLHICGDTSHLLDQMAQSGADLINVDHLVAFDKACCAYGERGVCFKGNLDPVTDLFQATPEHCATVCRERIKQAAGLPYMLSPGCEVPPGTPDAVFEAFCLSAKL